ncbi:MAG: hypothetical protein OEM82_11410 [Acidobacteriota bacterium]|nr:hypothetical protein [Acidobacteriota bacterium]
MVGAAYFDFCETADTAALAFRKSGDFFGGKTQIIKEPRAQPNPFHESGPGSSRISKKLITSFPNEPSGLKKSLTIETVRI